jgi:hypothetical protein
MVGMVIASRGATANDTEASNECGAGERQGTAPAPSHRFAVRPRSRLAVAFS